MINGVTQLIMMKSDVLDGFETVKACTAYKINGNLVKEFPFSIEKDIVPQYVEMKWRNTDLSKCKSDKDFPQEFKDYIDFLEKELETPITIISVGPNRDQTIIRSK